MIRSRRGGSAAKAEARWLKVFGTLHEFQARLFAADKALDLGRGGIRRLARLTGLSRTTITKACASYCTLSRFRNSQNRLDRSRAAVPFANRDTLERLIEHMAAVDDAAQ